MFGHTTSTKTAEVQKNWVLIDAEGLVVQYRTFGIPGVPS